MTPIIEKLLTALVSFKEDAKKENFYVPAHEIVMSPSQIAEFLDSEDCRRHMNPDLINNNFHGVDIIPDPSHLGDPIVRRRVFTLEPSDDHFIEICCKCKNETQRERLYAPGSQICGNCGHEVCASCMIRNE